MKKLVAIMTCRKRGYEAKANAQRDTWVRQVRAQGVDVVFFIGARHEGSDAARLWDEVWLDDVRDDYAGIPHKVRAICAWAAERNYDCVSKVDDDVYVVPARYAAQPYTKYDYVGRFRGPCGNYPAHFASGFFYTLSLRAAKLVASKAWNGDWMDERYVANALAVDRIYGHTDPASYLVTGPFHPPADLLKQNKAQQGGTAYCQYGPNDMHEMHRCFGAADPVPVNIKPAPRAPVSMAQFSAAPMDSIPVEKLQRG